jgi:AraC family transcriptional regulator
MSYIGLIQHSIDYMEENLFHTLSLKSVAKHVHVSAWHFHRLFGIVAGEQAAMYIRKRRLSIAALKLLESDKRIIEIAVELGFSSHESFTRSFKQITGITPEQYRKLGITTFHYPMLSFTENELFSAVSMLPAPEVRIVSFSKLQVAGLRLKGLSISSSSSMEHNQKKIEKLWQFIHSEVEHLREQVGVIIPTGGTRFDYIAGTLTYEKHLHSYSEDWEVFNIPKQTYAVASHTGTIEELPQLFKYMVGNYLPKAKYELVYGPELELYRFDNAGKMIIEVHIPIQKI